MRCINKEDLPAPGSPTNMKHLLCFSAIAHEKLDYFFAQINNLLGYAKHYTRVCSCENILWDKY